VYILSIFNLVQASKEANPYDILTDHTKKPLLSSAKPLTSVIFK
jgi:hypothetical protein